MSNVITFRKTQERSAKDALNEALELDFDEVQIVGVKNNLLTLIGSSVENTSETIGRLQRLSYWLSEEK